MPGIGTIHTIGSLVVASTVPTTQFKLDGVTTRNFSPGLQELMAMPAGQADVDYVATNTIEPIITLTGTDIAVILASIGLSGVAIGTTPNDTADAYFTKMQEGGVRASGSVNSRLRVSKGLLVVNSVTWSHPGAVTAEVQLHATYDGTNAVVIYTATLALPHVPVVEEMFSGGPVFINGTELDGIQGITFDLGLSVVKRYASGNWRPFFAGISERKPRITITTKEVPFLSTVGIEGLAQSATPSEIYFRKMTKHGTRVANATTQHIKITIPASAGEIWAGEFGGGNNEDAAGAVIIQPTDLVTISTASAIPGSS
jgi:hypothetical protein